MLMLNTRSDSFGTTFAVLHRCRNTARQLHKVDDASDSELLAGQGEAPHRPRAILVTRAPIADCIIGTWPIYAAVCRPALLGVPAGQEHAFCFDEVEETRAVRVLRDRTHRQ
jgi:hypothetical protein